MAQCKSCGAEFVITTNKLYCPICQQKHNEQCRRYRQGKGSQLRDEKKRLAEERNKRIIELALDGYAAKEIGPIVGCSYGTVQRVLQDNGIKAVKKYPEGCHDRERDPKMIERERKIVELREQNISCRQIAKILGMNHGTVSQIAKSFGVNGVRAQLNEWQNPNDYLLKYNPNLEYVSGWTSVDGYAVIRCKDCGNEYECSMKTIRSHPEYKCKFCSEIERREQAHRKAVQRTAERNRKLREKEEAFWSRSFEQKTVSVCPVCRSVFVATHGRKYCSDACARKVGNQHNSDRRLRLIKEQTVDKDITLAGLYEKYNGYCYICGNKCDWDDYEMKDKYFVAGANYPSIDHVIPLAKGGEHSWNNIKLACRKCNWEKSDCVIEL